MAASLEDGDILKALERIEKAVNELTAVFQKAFTQMEGTGSQSFNKMAANAQKAFTSVSKSGTAAIDEIKKKTEDLGITGLMNLTNVGPPVGPTTIPQLTEFNQAFKQQTPEFKAETAELEKFQQQLISAKQRAEILDLQMVGLLATELRVASGADTLTRNFITQAQASSRTTDQFLEQVSTLDTLSDEQLKFAIKVATTKQQLLQARGAFVASGKGSDVLLDRITELQDKLFGLDATLEGGAASLQTEAERLRQNAVAAQQAARGFQVLGEVARRNQAAGERQFLGLLRTFPQVRKELDQIVRRYGSFNVVVGQSGKAQGEAQQAFLRAVNSDKQLQSELDKLIEKYGQFNIAVNRANFALKEQTSGKVARNIGITAGIVSSLTSEFIQLGRIARETFERIIVDSVKVSREFETARISFRAIFEGNQEIASATFDFVRQLSREFGTDITTIAAAFLPQVENIEQLRDIAEVSQELLLLPSAIAQGKSQADAILAISEALAGQFRSLQTRFNLTIEETRQLRAALQERGIGGFLEDLDKILESRGIQFSEFTNTVEIQLGKAKESVRDFQNVVGTPIKETLKDFLADFNKFITDNREDLILLADAFGQLIGQIAQFAADEFLTFLKSVDLKEALEGVQNTQRLVDQIRGTLEVFKDAKREVDGFREVMNFVSDSFDRLVSILPGGENAIINFQLNVETLNKTFTALQQAAVIGFAGIQASIAAAGTAIQNLDDLISKRITFAEFSLRLDESGAEAFKQAFQELSASIDDGTDRLEDNTKATNENTNAQIAAGDVIIERQRRLEEQAQLEENLVELEKKLGEERNDLETDLIRRRLEMARDLERKKIDLELDSSRARAKIEQDLIDKLEDIDIKFNQKRDDIFRDFARDSVDASTDYGRELEDTDKETAKKRLDIELEFQRRLEELRRRFEFDAQEAIRQNDAIRFLELRRRLAFEIEEAKKKRDEDKADAELDAKEKREDAVTELRRENEDLKLERDRALEDARIDRQREIEEANLDRDRALRDQIEKEKQLSLDLKTENDRRNEDFKEYIRQKEEDYQSANKEEIKAVFDTQKRLLEIEKQFLDQRLKQQQTFQRSLAAETRSQLPGGTGTTGQQGASIYALRLAARNAARAKGIYDIDLERFINTASPSELVDFIRQNGGTIPGGSNTPVGRQFGGTVLPGVEYLVGERGPEIFKTSFPGRIEPLQNRLNYSLPALSSQPSNIDNSRNFNSNFSLLDPTSFTPAQLVIIEKMIKQVLLNAMHGI